MVVGAALLGIWELLVDTHLLHYQYLPSPSEIAGAVGTLLRTTHLWSNLGHTVSVTFEGWAISCACGIAVGAALGLSRRAWRWSMATVEVLRALPAIAFVPVAVLIFGLSSRMELTVVVYVAFWPVVINVVGGVQAVHPLLRDVSRTFQLRPADQLRKIVIPAATPQVIVGVRLALTLSLVLAVVAEMIGNPAGLGYQLVFEQQALRPTLMFGYVVIIGLLGLTLNSVLISAIRLVAPGLVQRTGGVL